MSEERIEWTTEHEFKFVKRIGMWGFSNSRHREIPRLTLLENYLRTCMRRQTFSRSIDKEKLIEFIKKEIDNEKKLQSNPIIPKSKTKCKRKKKVKKEEV